MNIPQHSHSMNGAFKGRGRNFLSLLVCPIDRSALVHQDGMAVCSASPAHAYPFEDGILRLAHPDHAPDLASWSDQHEAQRAAAGWQPPDEAGFKSLPQTALNGYPVGYWSQYAAATALLWRFLEAIRLQNGGLPVGPIGEAAVLNAGMGWLAYGLDVAGYTTLAVDAHVGPNFGLGVYPIARYVRVQAHPLNPPLAREALDLVIFQEGLPLDRAIEPAVHALRAGGALAIIDALDPSIERHEATRETLHRAGLALMDEPQRDSWRARLGTLRDRITGRDAAVPPVMVARKPK